jgi:hypothetical protein
MARRRQFIQFTAATAVAATSWTRVTQGAAAPKPPADLAAVTKFTEPLPVLGSGPGQLPVVDATGGGAFDLAMHRGSWQFHAALPPTPPAAAASTPPPCASARRP